MKKYLLTFVFACSLLRGALAIPIGEVNAFKHRVIFGLPHLEGWCSAQKAIAMIDLIVLTKPDVCVEIGVFGGASILPTASALKYLDHGVVYAVDPWDTEECVVHNEGVNRQWWSEVDLNKIYHAFLNMLAEYELEDFCIIHKATSEKFASEIDSIDILHIDGNHSEISSLYDVTTYFPKVKPGGYIWYDDVKWPTTQKAVEWLTNTCELVLEVDDGNCKLFRKPKN